MSYLTNTAEAPYSGTVTIHGPPGHGKTTFAASASEHFESKDLKDMLFLQFDLGGLDGLKAKGYKVAFIDTRALMAEKGAVRGTFDALDILAKHTEQNKDLRYIVVDTISEMDKLWHEAIDKIEDDGRALYRQMLNNHIRFYNRVINISLKTAAKAIFIAHSKAKVLDQTATEGQKKTQTADKLPGGNDIQVDVTGQGHGIYTRNGSLVIAMQCRSIKGKPDVYVALPNGGGGFEGKNRFKGILNEEESPNLRAIFNKLK